MKKVLTAMCALALLAGCSKPAESAAPASSAAGSAETAEPAAATGEYEVFNMTGGKVTELYLYETGSDKGENLVAEKALKAGGHKALTFEGKEDTVLTLEFVSETTSGAFETLHIETAPITLLAEDARTGATVINFVKPEGTGTYTVYNVTGETVTELYLHETASEDKGTNYAEGGMAEGADTTLTFDGFMDAVLTIEFVTESGATGAFTTLHIEEAPISLLAEDARTGATEISFSKPE